LTVNNKKYADYKSFHKKSSIISQKHKKQLIECIDDDTVAYNAIISARRLSKKTKDESIFRDKQILKATIQATDIPFKILQISSDAISEAHKVSSRGNKNSISDIGVASNMLHAAAKGAFYNILINLTDELTVFKPFIFFKAEINVDSFML